MESSKSLRCSNFETWFWEVFRVSASFSCVSARALRNSRKVISRRTNSAARFSILARRAFGNLAMTLPKVGPKLTFFLLVFTTFYPFAFLLR